MFDSVKVMLNCPFCGEAISRKGTFQSKDGACELGEIDWEEVDGFYGRCYHCGKWIEYQREERLPRKFDPKGWVLKPDQMPITN